MIIPVTSNEEIKWLYGRLYEINRDMRTNGVACPVFVLTTRTTAERRIIEEKLLHHFRDKFGIQANISHDSRQRFSSFCLPGGINFYLIDIEE